MDSGRRRTLLALAVAAVAGVGAGLVVGLNEDDEPEPSAGSAATSSPAGLDEPPAELPGDAPSDAPEQDQLPPPENDPKGLEPGPSGPQPESADEQAAATAARGYIQALDRRSGAAVCRAFRPGLTEAVAFPEPRSSCPATVEASLGYAKRGLPVWEHSQMTAAVSARVEGETARVVATVFTVYADVREPTIEDDIIYLTRDGDRWLVTKPSLTLYRAIGNADPPLSVLSPP